MTEKRTIQINDAPLTNGPVIYWMSRDQRIHDNWAFIAAQNRALETSQPLYVLFVLVPSYPCAVFRHYHFMLEGLKEVEAECSKLNIPFILKKGSPPLEVNTFAKQTGASAIYTDFDPLKIKRQWKARLKELSSAALFTVDAHNIVPAWVVSQKNEYSAATFRKKHEKLMDNYLDSYPLPRKMDRHTQCDAVDWDAAYKSLKCDMNVQPIKGITPGRKAGMKELKFFLQNKLHSYNNDRNDPTRDATSNLSPWLHFGQISPQKAAMELVKAEVDPDSRAAFWNEIVTWREVSDNLCLYNPDYDSPEGFANWATETLENHLPDDRDYVYTLEQFENAATHEELWNAAQRQLVNTGKIHSYMRMYWAKKILEWTANYREAFDIALYLNDKYALDGRDPNGYAGVAWAIGGVHDHPWFERPVYGKIRYMNENGCRRKFDADRYIKENR